MPEAPKVMPAGNKPVAVHGDLRACADGRLIRIERIPSRAEQREEDRINAILHARADREAHAAEAERTKVIAPFACVFHLDRLLALSPEDRPALLKRRAGILSAALKSSPNDHHFARSLARQAVADPGTVPDAKSLLAAVARHPDAARDWLHGALLLRTGNARDAALILRAAARHRAPDAAPIEELLLALALVKLDRRDEARQHLKNACWTEGTTPQRAAALFGLRPAGPLAALTALAQMPCGPRLNPLDPFTAHELATLRAEVERALGQR
jgi:hypothetical protein